MTENDRIELDSGQAVAERRPKLKKPRLFKVVLLNDDFTPMDFVVGILIEYFLMNNVTAQDVMMQVHHKGYGVCGIFTHDIAETKVAQVNEHSCGHQYPLLCTMEVE